jgi:hypothetical protein
MILRYEHGSHESLVLNFELTISSDRVPLLSRLAQPPPADRSAIARNKVDGRKWVITLDVLGDWARLYLEVTISPLMRFFVSAGDPPASFIAQGRVGKPSNE